MLRKIKNVVALPDYILNVQFIDGITKKYDIKPLFKKINQFNLLKDEGFFESVEVDVGGYGIVWNDDLDLSAEEIWSNGTRIETPFDDLMSLSDATSLWQLNESTLRKAIHYGKIVNGVDARKYGKQWIVTRDAMIREYGEPIEPLV